MSNKKFSFLKNSPSLDINYDRETKDISTTDKNNNADFPLKYEGLISELRPNHYPILDKKIISFVVSNFPEISKEIITSLNNLKNTLEKSIDYIEDNSSKIIKKERNFDLSEKYRNNAINLYEISTSIENYIKWMDTQSPDKDNKIEDKSKSIDNSPTKLDEKNISSTKKELNICNDFTEKQPTSFRIDEFNINVEDWNDMIIKTADILIKNYKKSKDLYYSTVQSPNIQSKKSIQNEFRDTIIEMLIEYKIDPVKYSVIIK